MRITAFFLSLFFSEDTLLRALRLRPNVLHAQIITMDEFTEQYNRWAQAKGPTAVPPLTDLDRSFHGSPIQ